MRKTKFQNGYYYHVFNRGTDKRNIFMDEKDYFNFLVRLRSLNNNSTFEQRKELNSKALELSSFLATLPEFVEIIAYCLNPNHYHLLLEQKQENGISKLMHKLGTAYTNYFNERYKRSGSLFQGRYKSVEIKTDSQLHYLSSYINANPEIHNINKAEEWKYSSYRDYLGKRNGKLINKEVILKDFKDLKDYREYTKEVIKNSKEIKKEIKKYLLEN